MKTVHHILHLSAETVGAFTTVFSTVNLHCSTYGRIQRCDAHILERDAQPLAVFREEDGVGLSVQACTQGLTFFYFSASTEPFRSPKPQRIPKMHPKHPPDNPTP
jgi:hypothetical protein